MNDKVLITIPIPMAVPRKQGIWATGEFGRVLRFRVPDDTYQLIKTESQMLGITMSNFIRWTAEHTALQLERKRYGSDRKSP